MPIASNPVNTRVTRDVRNYRTVIDGDATVEAEVKKEIKDKDSVNFPNPTKPQIKEFKGYKVFAYHQEKTNKNLPHRLGGGLNLNRPSHLGPALHKPAPGTTFDFNPPGGKPKVSIVVRADGAIVHTDAAGNELHDVHEYMHAIFDDILYMTRDFLEDINEALETYAEDPLTPANSTAYRNAVLAFDDFLANLQPGGSSPYVGAFNSVGIDPVLTNEGFIVSCRVKLNWKNPFHSSSTIKIP